MPQNRRFLLLRIITLSVVVLVPTLVVCFPQGAPTEACESLSPRRGHGYSSHGPGESPFVVLQSASAYKYGDQINVNIVPMDPSAHFKGFLVQARDGHTGKYVGRFFYNQGLTLMPECGAVTHSEIRPKQSVSLIWTPQEGESGHVVFRSTIVQNKTLYYENLGAVIYP